MRFLIACLALLAAPALADDIEVDVELFLAADVSRSMSPRELEIQRRGYAEALASPEVIAAIERGFLGRVAIIYVEWAGAGSQRIIAPWTLIQTAEEAKAFANQLTARFDPGLRRTSISDAIDYAALSFTRNGFTSFRQVIDVSGDGPNNMGRMAPKARDAAVQKGIVINGLPLLTKDGVDSRWHLDDLDIYYEQCVIGGPGAFVIPVLEWEQFPAAVRRKIVLEIAGQPARLMLAQEVVQTPYDCLIGEKMWEQMRFYWDEQ